MNYRLSCHLRSFELFHSNLKPFGLMDILYCYSTSLIKMIKNKKRQKTTYPIMPEDKINTNKVGHKNNNTDFDYLLLKY